MSESSVVESAPSETADIDILQTDQIELASNISLLKDAPYILVSLTDNALTPSGTSLSSEEISANEQKVYRFLTRKMGLNTAAACGIMANIRSLSNFDPSMSSDNDTRYGICQWHGDRKTNLINWCKTEHHKYNTLSGQLYYLQHEISQNNPDVLWNGKNIYTAMLEIDNTAASGYQIQYCTDKAFPEDQTALQTIRHPDQLSVTISSLPVKNRYYVRVRAYVKTESGTFFSKWSTVKQQIVR